MKNRQFCYILSILYSLNLKFITKIERLLFWEGLYFMGIVSQFKSWKAARSLAFLNLWHFLWYAAFLSGLPLFLAITFSWASGDGWDSLASRFFTDILLTTFALTICVCGESTQPTYNKSAHRCRDISVGSSFICFGVYFAFYHMEIVIKKILGEKSWNVVEASLAGQIGVFFKLCLFLYIVNIAIGIYVTYFYFKRQNELG